MAAAAAARCGGVISASAAPLLLNGFITLH